MKSILKLSLLTLLATFFISASFPIDTKKSGIQFHEGKWAAALAKAKKNNQLIFLDANAAWCMPCKRMEKLVFTDAEVGKYFNSKFVNVKMDMEKREGIKLGQKYRIKAYPTLLFINGEGKVVHQAVGYKNAAGLIALGKVAQSKK